MRSLLAAVAVLGLALSTGRAAQPEPSPKAQEYEAPTNGQDLEGRVTALEEALQQVLEENERLRREVRTLNRAIGDLANEDAGRYVPRIFGNMTANDEFKSEVMRANQGVLRIHNQMGRPVRYYINGARWRIPPGRHAVKVPLGEVTVHTESEISRTLDDWKLSADGTRYELRVSIRTKDSVPHGS